MADILLTRLSAYLAGVAARNFAYGENDCCTFMADWLVSIGLPDPMADRRGSYRTAREYRAAIRREGGIVESCRRRFGAIGLVEAEAPELGDVALVLAPCAVSRRGRVLRRPTGAIVQSARWRAVLAPPRGIAGACLPIVAAWTVRHA